MKSRIASWSWFGLVALHAVQYNSGAAPPQPSSPTTYRGIAPPFPTGTHLQLGRQFFSAANGLPSDDVRAVTVTRDGTVFVATGKGLTRLENEQWITQTGPAGVNALYAPGEGPNALAGGTNG